MSVKYPIRSRRKNARPEEDEQRALVRWAAYHPWSENLIHVPNQRTNAVERQVLSAMGVRPGFPDLALFQRAGDWPACFIELKCLKRKPTNRQRAWLERLERQGFLARWVQGWPAARFLLEWYVDPERVASEPAPGKRWDEG